jgi:hypothetical protein
VKLAATVGQFGLFQTITREGWDVLTPLAIAGLGAFGVAFIYSAQLPVNGGGWLTHGAGGAAHLNGWAAHLASLGLGAAVYLAVSLIDYRFWLNVAHWCYAGKRLFKRYFKIQAGDGRISPLIAGLFVEGQILANSATFEGKIALKNTR